MEIKIKNIKEKQVAYIFMIGDYDQLPQLFYETVGYVIKKGMQITGPPYGTYHNSPMEMLPEELQFEVGIPFIGEVSGEGRVKIRKIPAHQAVSTVYKGYYRQATQIYQALIEYAAENDHDIVGPVTEIYINNPMEVSESKLLTEVQFPVIKKQI